MTFEDFCKEHRVKEIEAHELVDFLAAYRMRQTLYLHQKILPDESTAEIIEKWRRL